MKDAAVANVRNLAFMGHTGCGKTTLMDALLFRMGVNDRKGAPESGTSLLDFTDEEKSHKISVWAKPAQGCFKTASGADVHLALLDTPGYADFAGQTIAAERAADSILVCVDATSGLQVGSSRAWRLAEKAGKPRGIVVTGLDKENADVPGLLEALRSAWGPGCIPVALCPADRSRVEGLFRPEADAWDGAEAARSLATEAAAEADDALLEKFLGGEALSAGEIVSGIRAGVRAATLFPVFLVSAKTDLGLDALCQGLSDYFPSPLDRPAADADGRPVSPEPEAPFTGFVWRTIADPFVGHLSLVRVLGGTLSPEGEIWNATQGQKERIGSILALNGKKQEPAGACRAGDLIALPKLKSTRLNDTLCAMGHSVRLRPMDFPLPVVHYAVSAKNQGEEDKLAGGMSRVSEQDPTLRVERNKETHEMILAGMGDMQINIAVESMKKTARVEVALNTPRVAYKETINGSGEGHYKHKKQSGGRGQYGEVYLRVAPKTEDDPDWFVNAVVGGTIPTNFIPAVQKGLVEGLLQGALARYPVEGVKVTVYDGSYHDVDSSEVAFKIAASRALRDALGKARPVLLEPIMKLRILIPDQCMGDVTGDLNHKRGRVLGMDAEDGLQVIQAEIPQAETFSYSSQLRSLTGGRGSFEMAFSRMEVCPANVAQKVIAEAAKGRGEEED